MRLKTPHEFLSQAAGALAHAAADRTALERFEGLVYCCACGRAHRLTAATICAYETGAARQRVLLACPDVSARALTLVQLRDGARVRVFSESGCRLESDETLLAWLEEVDELAARESAPYPAPANRPALAAE